MSTDRNPVYTSICEAFSKYHPSLPVEVKPLPDDERILCVRVFAVPVDSIKSVKMAIREIDADLFPDGSFMLLPMVKDLATTREHYPEHIPSIDYVDLLQTEFICSANWHAISTTVFVGEATLLSTTPNSTVLFRALDNTSMISTTCLPIHENVEVKSIPVVLQFSRAQIIAAANDQMALAA